MRLIDTRTFELKDFGGQPPPYAILSHTWDEDEVTFQDMADLDAARKKKGFAKIEQCCRQAVRDAFDWAWIDTCCIDKTSSAELSETINSMFKWYERAMKCYAFLSDLTARPGDELFAGLGRRLAPDPDAAHAPSRPRDHYSLFASRWWTRGWTLQELIAPHNVEFYNCDWEYLTCKRASKRLIAYMCDIAEPILEHSRDLLSYCVAERISWASRRNTTREEDMAYCLLGILDVNMPLLYGEGGRKAFLRLQEHVIAANEDYTLYLWGRVALAASPRDFNCGQVWSDWSHVQRDLLPLGEPPQITSRGIRLSLFIRRVTRQDFYGASRLLPCLLNYLFVSLKGSVSQNLLDSLRPGAGGLARPQALFLGAFPSPSNERFLPCMLYLDLGNVGYALGETSLRPDMASSKPRTYARFKYFYHEVSDTELRKTKGWNLRTCYIKTRPDAEMPEAPGLLPTSVICVWRTPTDIPYEILELNTIHAGETRRFIQLHATAKFPGCVISVAIRNRSYWLNHRVGEEMDYRTEAERFATMDLDHMWVETRKEVGPFYEERIEFGTRSILITLSFEKCSGVADGDGDDGDDGVECRCVVYLALVETRP
ncbi:heterokaryon incompatibility protein-domain-containing protein [Chaetomidium leptoderma]|uniref:Heterokaryon incompatibility protein-domain-containing protein n=1 Tax=Chaetomidium leptoderma TaxID=669021 RepID=A0AAN6VKK4_9PEZI|nr:heterokaryon incompatibility protein-domain-containing protein [Chaetomidium leptoderma]